MRLLEHKNDDEFTLTKDIIDNIPPYAILSHTWGADTEEVTFRDLTDGTGKDKTGYSKIRFCGEQAKHDSLQYVWVDTCCIDKSNNTELVEAINSMFRWYRNAAKCYVYLSDVPRDAPDTDDAFCQLPWESAFRESRWFTRGWTLQELIAPKSVEFFSKYWEQLGNKVSLGTVIHEITGIPDKALQGAPLSGFTVAERMSWAEQRETTRKEDQAYSLLGIFDVYMPLIYSEGKEHAFKRLREVINVHSRGLDSNVFQRLPYALDAPFNSYAKQDSSTCLPNTQVGLLEEIYNWVDTKNEQCIFWLNGLAGTGKSTIARTVARRYFEQKRLGASFFFSKGGGDVGHAGKFCTSIAVQLAHNAPPFRRYISEAAEKQIDIANHSLRDQWRQLVLHPLSRLDKCLSPSSYLLIVDALDECDNEDHVRTILQLLAEARSFTTVRLRVFLTSRPENSIRHGICAIPQAEHYDFVLHSIQPTIVNHDISLLLEYNLGIIRQKWTLGADWPGEVVLRQLDLYACGLFISAVTACRFIHEGGRFAHKRLDTILKSSSSAITTPEKHLDKIYLAVLKHSISSYYSDEEREEACDILKHILGSIAVSLSPLSASSLSRLLHFPNKKVDQTFKDLYAILDIPEDPTYPLRLHHPSFRDFLLSKDRCGEFWVNEKQAHYKLATRCIQLMSQTLKKYICEIQAPGSQASQVESSRVQKYLPPEVQYACLYWVQHLQRSGSRVYDGEEAHRFLQAHLLHWLEALGWMGKTSEGIQAILSLEAHVPATESPNLHAFIHDAKRFALYNRSVIEQAPLQLYCSALIFAPERSIVRRQFEGSIPTWIQRNPKVQADWSAALQTLEGHSSWVSSVAFSPDGKQVISGSGDQTVRLWDAATGALLQTLEDHSSWVSSVAFSPDGKQVVSGSDDRTVRLWDAATGAPLQTLEGHSGSVSSVAFSPDGKQVVSGSSDRMVRLWDAATGALLQTLEGHSSSVTFIAFSPNGKQVVSGSEDGTVRLWDAATGSALQTVEGHSSSVNSVAFSPNGKQVISGSEDGMVRLWDAATGSALQTVEGHSSSVNSVAFSPDGKQVISGSEDGTVRLWDAATGLALQTLEAYSRSVASVAFSPHGKLSTLHISNHWLVEGTTNILLLPANYRPTCEAVWDRSVILGHSSGRISFLQIKEGPKYGFHHAATNQGGALPVHDSAIGSLEGSLAIEQKQEISIGNDSGLFSNDDVFAWNNEDDIQSIPSVPDDIQSQSSTKRTAQYQVASDQIGELLARHNQLGPLYEVVLSKIGKKRLVENLRRLLKQYYLDLFKTAQTNLEKASVSPLRSRWNRVRIAQQISDIVDPEIIDDPEPSVSEVPNNRARLESWLSSNPGFNQGDKIVNEAATTQLDKTWFGQTERVAEQDLDQASELDSDDINSNRSDYGHNIEHSNAFPKIAEVEKFFLEGDSFRRLLTSLQTFLLPVSLSSLTRVLMSVPKDDIWFSDKNDHSIMNKFKIAIENITEENWNWWPMRPKMRMLQGNCTRVHWRCRCGTHLWAELLEPHAETYKALLARRVDDPLQRHHLCTSRRGKRFGGAWPGWINQALGTSFWPTSKTQAPGIPLHNLFQTGPPTHRHPPERATPIGNSPSRSIPALATDQGTGVFIPATSELFVLFAVQGARRTLELAHINVDQKVDDEAFFQNIRIRYKEKRGFLRYWLSIWQLKDCEMAMFKKVQKGRVLFTKNDLPTDDLYEYTPKPPMTELPHIFPHEFEFALRPPCKLTCPLASFHDCVEPRCGNAILERIPKRKCRLQLTDNQPEEAWGLKAHYTPHFLLVLFYHCLVFVSTFAFWAWWLFVHPDDLQNASVPFMAAVAIVSMFWSSVATLKALR